jgi:hypothetical protein
LATGVTTTAVPLKAFKFPGVMTPDPFAKTPVNETDCPAEIVVAEAVNELIVGAAGSAEVVIAAFLLTEAPSELVTVRV